MTNLFDFFLFFTKRQPHKATKTIVTTISTGHTGIGQTPALISLCENGWIRVDYNGQTCYASGDFVTTTAPAADAGETAADTSADTSYDESAE